MGSQDNVSQPQAKKPTDVSVNENRNIGGSVSGQESASFSRLMEGVVFALSGFVNPERGMLRTQALEMGAGYQSDWNSKCTLLICAFPNTPKFRQVKTECGTVVSKSGTANLAVDYFSPSKLKKWDVDDLSKTVTWLGSQEEKAEESEIKKIAAEGILTCIYYTGCHQFA